MVGKKQKTIEQTPARGWRNLLERRRIFILLIVLGLFPLFKHLMNQSEQKLITLPEYQVHYTELQLTDRPAYVPEELLERAWLTAELPEEFSILEPGIAKKIGAALETSPWVRQVRRVELKHPRQIEFDLVYRRPVAIVKTSAGYYPIDRDGILLPPMDFSSSQLSLFPTIENVQSLPQGAAGSHWGDLAVWGAGRLIELLIPEGDLTKHWKRYDLLSVKVSGRVDLAVDAVDRLNQISYRISTNNGSEIIWGVAPDVPDPTEPDAATKLKRLSLYFEDFGSLDPTQSPVEIDLRRWKDIARRPLHLPGESSLTR